MREPAMPSGVVPCRFGQRCGRRLDCTFKHTELELHNFRTRPHINFAVWKAQMCRSFELKPHPAETCAFAHSQAELYCLRCKNEGHPTDHCPYVIWPD